MGYPNAGYRYPGASQTFGSDPLGSLVRVPSLPPIAGVPQARKDAARGLERLSKALGDISSGIAETGGDWRNTGFSGSTSRSSDTRPIPGPITTPSRPSSGASGPGITGDFAKNAGAAWAEVEAAAQAVVDGFSQLSGAAAFAATEMFAPFTGETIGVGAGFLAYKIGDALLPDADADRDRRNREREGVGRFRSAPGRGRGYGAGMRPMSPARALGALASGLMQLGQKVNKSKLPPVDQRTPFYDYSEDGCGSPHGTICAGWVDGASECLDGQAWPAPPDHCTFSAVGPNLSYVEIYESTLSTPTVPDFRAHYSWKAVQQPGVTEFPPNIVAQKRPGFAPLPEIGRRVVPQRPTESGPAAGGSAGGVTPGRGDRRPVHRLRPPGRGVRERKPTVSRTLGAAVQLAIAAVTEGIDMIDAVYDALPGEFKIENRPRPAGDRRSPTVGGPTPVDKIGAVYKAIGRMPSWQAEAFEAQALANIAREAAEDVLVGSMARAAGRKAGGRFGAGGVLAGPAL